MVTSGETYVVVKWGITCVAGVYAPPSLGVARFEAALSDIEGEIKGYLPGPVLVMGDFNAKFM